MKYENKALKEWAQKNGLANVYAMYVADMEDLDEELEIHGLPSNVSTYGCRAEAIERMYPELFD